MCFFLAQISLMSVANAYVHIYGILDRGLVPKLFSFRQRTVLRAEETRPGVATYVDTIAKIIYVTKLLVWRLPAWSDTIR